LPTIHRTYWRSRSFLLQPAGERIHPAVVQELVADGPAAAGELRRLHHRLGPASTDL
jgi:hypothetical protein